MQKTTTPSCPKLLNELTLLFLTLSWILERHSQEVVGQPQDKHRLYFRPFWERIGFTSNPEKLDLQKSMPCKTPVGMHLLRFLTGSVVLPFPDTSIMEISKQTFGQMLSPGLRDLLLSEALCRHFPAGDEVLLETEAAYPSIRLVWDFIQKTKLDSTTSFFRQKKTRKGGVLMFANPMKVLVINQTLEKHREPLLAVARGLYEAHFCLQRWNVNLGMGLVTQSLVI